MIQKIKCFFGYHVFKQAKWLGDNLYKEECVSCGKKFLRCGDLFREWDQHCSTLEYAQSNFVEQSMIYNAMLNRKWTDLTK